MTPATLADQTANGHDLRAFCNACEGTELLDVRSLVAQYSEYTTLPEIRQGFKCTGCGATVGSLQVVAEGWR